MKKLLGIVVLGLLLCGNAFSKAYDIKVREKNQYGIIILIKSPLKGNFLKGVKAHKKTMDIAINYCNEMNKNTYAFWSEKTDFGARDKNGKPFESGENFGIVQDWYWKMLSTNYRYYCAKNINEAYDYLEKDDELFKKKYKTRLNFSKLFYSEININPFDFKSLETKSNLASDQPAITEEEINKKDKIVKYQNLCTELGFEKGTEKFADCALKLMLNDNKNTQTSKTTQTQGGIDWGKVAGEFDPKYKDNNKRICKKRKPTFGMTQDVGDAGVTEIITCEDQ